MFHGHIFNLINKRRQILDLLPINLHPLAALFNLVHVYPNTDFYVLNYLLLLLLCDLKRSLIDSLAFLNILGSSGHFDIRDCYITVQKLFTLALAMKKIFECRKSKCFLPKPGNQDLRSFCLEKSANWMKWNSLKCRMQICIRWTSQIFQMLLWMFLIAFKKIFEDFLPIHEV